MIAERRDAALKSNERTASALPAQNKMNCLCNLFDNEIVWLIIIALLVLNATCNGFGGNRSYGCGCNG